MSPNASLREPRPFCWTCRRARAVCICASVAPIPTRTRVVILQHETEAWNHIGSARLAHLGLEGSELLVEKDFSKSERLRQILRESGGQAALLWPSHDSTPLDALPPDARPSLLVLVDATWPRAKELVRYTPELASLRRVRLVPAERSRYRVRKQPRRGCLSTLEAAAQALALLEGGEERFRPLVLAFDRMIERQIEQAAALGRSIVPDARKERAKRPFPEELSGDLSSIVIVQGETLRRRDGNGPSRVIDLVQWGAIRLATRERFDAILETRRPLSPEQAAYLGLSPPDLESRLDHETFRTAWNAFARPGDVNVSWGFFASNELERIRGARLARQVDLRAAAKLVLNRRVRTPDDALWELEVQPPQALARGRCGRRLASLESILLGLREGRRLSGTAKSVSTSRT